MKNYITISLFVFWAVVVAVATAGLVFYDQNRNAGLPVANNVSTSSLSGNIPLVDNNSAKVLPLTKVPAKKVPSPSKVVTPAPVVSPTQTTVPPPVVTPAPINTGVTLTAVEVAKHNTAGDCWQIINGNVYNLTSLVNTHSGGSAAILQTCGQDGSAGFNTKYGRGSHSGSAQSILQSFLIGPLNQTVSAAQIVAPQTNPAQPVFSGQRGDDD